MTHTYLWLCFLGGKRFAGARKMLRIMGKISLASENIPQQTPQRPQQEERPRTFPPLSVRNTQESTLKRSAVLHNCLVTHLHLAGVGQPGVENWLSNFNNPILLVSLATEKKTAILLQRSSDVQLQPRCCFLSYPEASGLCVKGSQALKPCLPVMYW